MSDDLTCANSENASSTHEYYYMVGISNKEDKRDIDFVFNYTNDELNAAMMEQIHYNTIPEENRKDMIMTHKQRFSQGYLLAAYRKRMESVEIHLFKSITDIGRDELTVKVLALTPDELSLSKVDL